jgi:hypothetical protein
MTSTLNSFESISEASTALTEVSVSNTAASEVVKSRGKSALSHNIDKDLHGQIEDLLMALSDLQREQANLARELQREREEREEDQQVAKSMFCYLKESGHNDMPEDLLTRAEERFAARSKRISIIQTKHQLRDDLNQWREKHSLEAARCIDLGRQIDEHERENARLKEELREARSRIQDSYRDKQRLERTIQELRTRRNPPSEPAQDGFTSTGESLDYCGLREMKLVNRANSLKNNNFPKRNSSLGLQASPPSDHNNPAAAPEGSLLVELVNAKTAEAVARQELEEVKAKLDSLRKLVGNPNNPTVRSSPTDLSNPMTVALSPLGTARISVEQPKSNAPAPQSGGGGSFFSGWAKRSISTSSATLSDSK